MRHPRHSSINLIAPATAASTEIPSIPPPTVTTTPVRRPAGAYSPTLAFEAPNNPNVGHPAAAARCINPESLPTNTAQRCKHAAASGKLNRPVKSIAPPTPDDANPANTGAANPASCAPGPANTAILPPPTAPANRFAKSTNRAAGQTFPVQFAVGPIAITAPPAGNAASARARSTAPVHTTGTGGGETPKTAANCAILCPFPRRITARRRVGNTHEITDDRISTTRSHHVPTVARHNGGQCIPRGFLSKLINRSNRGIRTNTPSDTAPHATVNRACGYVRNR